jgi:hypothetical protein
MIKIAGSVDRSFLFPTNLAMAYAYYSDASRLMNYLPHIYLVREFSGSRFRMLYNTTELGLYHIRIFWDVETVLQEGHVIRIQPLQGVQPVKPEADVYSCTAQGCFSSQSFFYAGGNGEDETRIDYRLQLQAQLPAPLAARLMPGPVLNQIANSIMHGRIREIADGFIERSIDAFPHWLAELEQPRLHTMP